MPRPAGVVNLSRGIFPVVLPPKPLLDLFGETLVGVPLPYRRYEGCVYLVRREPSLASSGPGSGASPSRVRFFGLGSEL